MAKKKKVAKEQQSKEKKLVQYYYRASRVEQKEKEGWKPAKISDEVLGKIIERHGNDLVLMEKYV